MKAHLKCKCNFLLSWHLQRLPWMHCLLTRKHCFSVSITQLRWVSPIWIEWSPLCLGGMTGRKRQAVWYMHVLEESSPKCVFDAKKSSGIFMIPDFNTKKIRFLSTIPLWLKPNAIKIKRHTITTFTDRNVRSNVVLYSYYVIKKRYQEEQDSFWQTVVFPKMSLDCKTYSNCNLSRNMSYRITQTVMVMTQQTSKSQMSIGNLLYLYKNKYQVRQSKSVDIF